MNSALTSGSQKYHKASLTPTHPTMPERRVERGRHQKRRAIPSLPRARGRGQGEGDVREAAWPPFCLSLVPVLDFQLSDPSELPDVMGDHCEFPRFRRRGYQQIAFPDRAA